MWKRICAVFSPVEEALTTLAHKAS